jgi:hypothetical protein
MKTVTKYGLTATVFISIIGLFVCLQPRPLDRPAQQPETAAVISSDKQQTASHRCVQNRPFTTAYRVHTAVESELDQQFIYRSQMDFRVQLQQAPQDLIFGAATDIAISEATIGKDTGKQHPVDDVLFLTGAETDEHWAKTFHPRNTRCMDVYPAGFWRGG